MISSNTSRAFRDAGSMLLAAVLATSTLVTPQAIAAQQQEPAWCQPDCDDIVSDWSLTAYAVIHAANGYANPMAATRVLASMHIAMHDAANAAGGQYPTHAKLAVSSEAHDAAVAVAVAAHDVLVGLHPEQAAIADAALAATLLDAGVGPAVDAGRAVGTAAAKAILSERANDGAGVTEDWSEQEGAGHYRHVPGWEVLAAPHWRSIRPFALTSPQQFRTNPPPALDSVAYAADFAEVAATGGAVSSERSPEETAYAAFWYEFWDIGWNRVARVAAKTNDLDLWESARLFALVNVAMADSYVAGWDSKIHYDFWRPVTAVPAADQDGNPATSPIAGWQPYLPTPPIQDHPSTHATLGAAAATVLEELLEKKNFAMSSTTALPEAPWRSFGSFTLAAKENAESRIHAGIHFRSATEAGRRTGSHHGSWRSPTEFGCRCREWLQHSMHRPPRRHHM